MEIFERLQKRTGENDLDLLADLLDSAESVILARRFPLAVVSWKSDTAICSSGLH